MVDAANVIGSRPDGWWRDRAGAAVRLTRQIAELLATVDSDLDSPAAASAEPSYSSPQIPDQV
nr:hypothetical protein [Micromonospora sp. DSM 115978]